MKLSKPGRGLLSLLSLLVLLCSCSNGIVDPVGDLGSDAEPWAPLLSAEEAEELFGKPSTSSSPQFYGDYLYFLAPLSEKSKQITVYRYNVETDMVEYACRDTVCSHANSSCPFARVLSLTLICAFEDGIAYRCEPEDGLEWYNFNTGEHKFLAKEAENCYRVGETLYYDISVLEQTPEDLDNSGNFMRQLFRVDNRETGKTTLVAEGEAGTVAFYEPHELDGKEAIIDFSVIDPEGKPTGGVGAPYLYLVDPETGEQSLMNERCIQAIKTAGTHYMYYSLDRSALQEEDIAEIPVELCLTDTVTGETIVLAGNDEVEAEPFALTDRCAFWLKKDSENENRMLLQCYDYMKGEKKEYPLEGRWNNGTMNYCRGRIYLSRASQWYGSYDLNGFPVADDSSYLVVWDIASGAQRVIVQDKITGEH